MKILEDINNNAHELQEQMLEEILTRNAGTEYLSRFFPIGQADKQNFETNVPIVTYEDVKPYIDRIANGETSSILFADPLTQFIRSSGTSGGQQKLIPITAESFDKGKYHLFVVDIVTKKCFGGSDEGKSLTLYFSKPEIETPSGLVASPYLTFFCKNDIFKMAWLSSAQVLLRPSYVWTTSKVCSANCLPVYYSAMRSYNCVIENKFCTSPIHLV